MNHLKDNRFRLNSQISDSWNAFSHSQVCLQPRQPPLYPYFKRPEREPNCSTHVALGLRRNGAEPTLPVTIELPVVHKEKVYLNYTSKCFRDVITFLPEYMTSHCRRLYNRIHFAIPLCIAQSLNKGTINVWIFCAHATSRKCLVSKGHRRPPPPPQMMRWAKYVICI